MRMEYAPSVSVANTLLQGYFSSCSIGKIDAIYIYIYMWAQETRYWSIKWKYGLARVIYMESKKNNTCSGNYIGDSGAAALGRICMFTEYRNGIALILRENYNISGEGAHALGQALASSENLKVNLMMQATIQDKQAFCCWYLHEIVVPNHLYFIVFFEHL